MTRYNSARITPQYPLPLSSPPPRDILISSTTSGSRGGIFKSLPCHLSIFVVPTSRQQIHVISNESLLPRPVHWSLSQVCVVEGWFLGVQSLPPRPDSCLWLSSCRNCSPMRSPYHSIKQSERFLQLELCQATRVCLLARRLQFGRQVRFNVDHGFDGRRARLWRKLHSGGG
jgi:hypothetical protein